MMKMAILLLGVALSLVSVVSEFTYSTEIEAVEITKGHTHPLVGRNSFHHLITGLTGGHEYNVRVSAYNDLGYGLPQLSTPNKLKPGATVPLAPTDVEVTSVSERTAVVSWQAPVSNGGDAIVSYAVEWDLVNSFTSRCGDKIEIQRLEISRPTADDCTGSCQFNVGVTVGTDEYSTGCIDWNIDSADLQAAIRGFGSQFDDVNVETCGASTHCGDSTGAWEFGYAHTIKFESTGLQQNIDLMTITLCDDTNDDLLSNSVSVIPIQDGQGLSSGCAASFLEPIGRVETGTTATSFTIENLRPGIPVFIRVSAQNALGNSPPAVMGYPLQELSATPASVPEHLDYVGLSTDDDGMVHVEWSPPPFTKLEGNNGKPVLGYNIELATRVVEEQILTVQGDLGTLVQGQYKLQFGAEVTKCLDVFASAMELEYALEYLDTLDDVSVERSDTHHGYQYLVRFSGELKENGNVEELELAGAVCSGEASALLPEGEIMEDVVNIRTLVQGQTGGVPEIVSITTSSDAGTTLLSGAFHLSYDYIGDFFQEVPGALVTVKAGSRFVSTNDFDLRPFLRRGQSVKIANEILSVDNLDAFTYSVLPLSSYHVEGATSEKVYIMDNIVGHVDVVTTTTTATTYDDYSSLLREGEFIMLDNDVYAVSSIDSGNIHLGEPSDHTTPKPYLGSTDAHVIVYERKKIEVNFDESAHELDLKIESLPGIGSVDVSRIGPDSQNSFTWSVTFTSSLPSGVCTEGSPRCLTVEESTLLQGDNPEVETTLVREGAEPSYDKIALNTLINNGVFEIQTIRIVAEADDLDGKFTISFPKCPPMHTSGNPGAEVRVINDVPTLRQFTLGALVRPQDATEIVLYHSVSSKDLKSALESLSTIGIVDVSRRSVEFGYEWDVSFKSNVGNLPLLVVDGTDLLGTNPSAEVREETTGAYLDHHVALTNLTVSSQVYSAKLSAFNEIGNGPDTLLGKQDIGQGVIPLHIKNSRQPSTISTNTLVLDALSSSEYMVQFEPPQSNGEPITKYLLEWTSGGDFGTPEVHSFRILNSNNSSDTDGWFTLSYAQETTMILDHDVTSEDLENALNRLSGLRKVTVSREPVTTQGFEWYITFVENVGERELWSSDHDKNGLSLVENNLYSISHDDTDVEFSHYEHETGTTPPDYGFMAIDASESCAKHVTGLPSRHQKLKLSTDFPLDLSFGAYKLIFDGEETACINYDAVGDGGNGQTAATSLKVALEGLDNVAEVTVKVTDGSSGFPYDYDIVFHGTDYDYPKISWPLLQIVPADFGVGDECDHFDVNDAGYDLQWMKEFEPCANGNKEMQIIVAEGDSEVSGSFFVVYSGVKSPPISVSSSADDMKTILEGIPNVGEVSVSKVPHEEFGSAWIVIFETNYAPNFMVAIDEFVGGINSVVNVYQGAVISTGAEDSKYIHQASVSGDFRVHVGAEITEALAHDCTDARLMEALHKLDSFARVDVINSQNNPLLVTLSTVPSQTDSVLTVDVDLRKTLAIGEVIMIRNAGGTASEVLVLQSMSETSLVLDQAITLVGPLSAVVEFGRTSKSKQLLPGWFSILPSASLVSATIGDIFVIVASDQTFIIGDVVTISSEQYTVQNVDVNADEITLTFDKLYVGPAEVNLGNPEIFLFKSEDVEVETSFSMEGLLVTGDDLWVQDSSFVIDSVMATGIVVDGAVLSNVVGAKAYKTGNGHERMLLFKSHTANLNTFNVVPESNWRGAGSYLMVKRPNAVPPNQFVVGNRPEVQTIALRSESEVTNSVGFTITVHLPACSTTVQQCTPLLPRSDGSHLAPPTLTQESTDSLIWGASSGDVQTALEDLSFLSQVRVQRSPADGESATAASNFGFVYSITFLGEISATQLIRVEVVLDDVSTSAHVNRKHQGTSEASFHSSYFSLAQDTNYNFRLSASNAKGWSLSSDLIPAKTPLLGKIPSKPKSVTVLNQGKDWLQPYWAYPAVDGGLPISAYKIEVDDSPTFFKGSPAYQQSLISIEHEVQDILTDFDPDDSHGTASGTFTLMFGGEVSGHLNYACSEKEMADALSILMDVDVVGTNPIKVVRSPKGRGYRWRTTFTGVRGNLNLLRANGNMLTGNNPRVTVAPVSDGKPDITPGTFTPEVQSIAVRSLSQADGTFTIDFEGALTDPIGVRDTANQLKAALESLPTIKTATVDRWEYNTDFGLVIWDVTFSHMYHERIQGVGDVGLMRVADDSLLEGNSIAVEITEKIKGTVPLRHKIENLPIGAPVYFRVSAYNAAGFGPTSDIAHYVPTVQPDAPQQATLAVESRTSLVVDWIPPADDGGSAITGYKIEWFSTSPTREQQMITTSSEKGIDEVQAVRTSAKQEGIGGFFRLRFKDEETDDIAFDAPAEGSGSVKEKLERLSVIGKVDVEREFSQTLEHGLLATVVKDSNEVTFSASVPFSENDLLWLSGLPFRVSSIDDINDKITLGRADDPATPHNFPDDSAVGVPVFKWAYGFVWKVTFTSGHVGPQPLLVATPSNNWRGTNPALETNEITDGLQPMSGSFRLTMFDPLQNLYHKSSPIAHDASAEELQEILEHLVTVSKVSVTRSINGNGFNWAVTWESDVGDIELLSADGSQLNGPSAKVSVSEMVPSTQGENYGIKLLGSDKTDYIIGSSTALMSGTEYRVQISALNVNGYGASTNTSPLTEIPRGVPDSPADIQLIVLNNYQLKVVFSAPADDGGATIDSYRIEWDIDADFGNIQTSGYTHVLSGSGEGPFFYNIPISTASAWIERYVRVLAHNDRGWSVPQASTPLSAAPSLQLPGVPQNMKLEVTSHVGLVVSWDSPSAHLPVFGGDGGAPITSYVVEWDISESFDLNPQRHFLELPAAELIVHIGGRNLFTGVNQPTLQPGVRYYVRVGAFNSVGAGILAVATPASAIPALQLPSAPISSTIVPGVDASSLMYSYEFPAFDGGASMRGVFVEWGLSNDLESQVLDSARLPFQREVQNVAIDVPLANEEQWIEETVGVTNERQTIRTRVVGVDEIQVIQTSSDTVTDEVQTITTSSRDENEIQVLTVSGSAEHDTDTERQTIRSTAVEVAEIQSLDVTTARENEIQVITVYLPGDDADQRLDVGGTGWGGTFRLQFITTECEFCKCPDGDETDDNDLCDQIQSSMLINPFAGSLDDVLDGDNGAGLKFALESLSNIGPGNIEVTTMDDSNNYYFIVTFTGTAVLGNVPDLLVESDSILKQDNTAATTSIETDFCDCRISGDSENICSGDCSSQDCFDDNDGLGSCTKPSHLAGRQPVGSFSLRYTCEDWSDPWSLDESTVEGLPEAEADNNGISDTCINLGHPWQDTSNLIEFNSQPSDLSDRLEAISNVNPNVLVSRTRVATADAVGYQWLVTFEHNHGDLELLECIDDDVDPVDFECTVVEQTPGSMIEGTFSIHDSVLYDSDDALATALLSLDHNLDWDISATDMKTAIEAASESTFGLVDVVRTAYYVDETGKWSGGFEWAITFLDRIGNVPPLNINSDALVYRVDTVGNDASADATALQIQDGNELQGNFNLSFWDGNELRTSENVFGCAGTSECDTDIDADCDTNPLGYWTGSDCDQLDAVSIENLINHHIFDADGDPNNPPSIVEVSRNDAYYDKAGGKQWLITFVDDIVGADVPNLVPGFGGLGGSQPTAEVVEQRAGNQLVGTFRLRLDGYETGEIEYDASAEQMEVLLNSLVTIRPSKVKVSRETNWSEINQVRAYTWTVTFTSSTWHDPTDHSTSVEGPEGNWGLDSPAKWGDTWDSGYSKAWGRNVGDVSTLSCLQESLTTTLEGYEKDCEVDTTTPGTGPVGGTFKVTLDTDFDNIGTALHWTGGGDSAVNVWGTHESEPIVHNAVASRALSGSDGTSMEEILEALPNIGDIDVSRSDVDTDNGGYVWTITFLRDGDTCEEFETTSGLCNAPGDVPKFSADGTSTLAGDNAGVVVFDADDADAVALPCIHGQVLRGKFAEFKVTDDSIVPVSDALLWNAEKSDMKAYLEEQFANRIVEVDGRWIHSKYGSVEWLVRFTDNPGNTPPGTGDINEIIATGDAQMVENLDGGVVQIIETQKGSEGLSGTFTIDVSSPMGPVTVNFDEDADRLARKLNEMSTVGAVDVRKYEYPSPSSGGWGSEPVAIDETQGGYQWKVRFLSNPGSYDGLTFPPGSGDIETIQTDDGLLGGANVQVEVVENAVGSNPLGGTYSLSFEGATTSQLPYSASGIEVSDELESLSTIGEVTASRNMRVSSRVPGLYAVVTRDAASIQLQTDGDSVDTVEDPLMTLRRYVTNGDLIRIGGESGGSADEVGLTGSNGDQRLLGDFEVLPFSPVVSTSLSQTQILTAGETIRLAGDTYEIERSGTEKQVLTIKSYNSDPGLSFVFILSRNGFVVTSECIDIFSSTNTDIQQKLNDLPFFNDGDVEVTSLEDNTEDAPHVYAIYFEGLSAQGNVAQLNIAGCSDPVTVLGSDDVTIATEIEGGHIEVQQIVLAAGSGEVEGEYFKLGYGAEETTCIEWGASPSEVKDHLDSLTGIGDDDSQEIIVTRTGSGSSSAEIQQIVLASDVAVQEGTSAGYRLRWNHNGYDAITDCIKYHATADDIEDALSNMHCESGDCFPACDGVLCNNAVTDGHIRVTREGDGSSSWGYGYEISFLFEGPIEGGNSGVLSDVPEFGVVYNTGDANKCKPVESGNPIFRVDTLREGAPAYTYSVYFVGKLFSDVQPITIPEKGPTSSCWGMLTTHSGGSTSDVWIETVQNSGSQETYRADISNVDTPITAGTLNFIISINAWDDVNEIVVVNDHPSGCVAWDDLNAITTAVNDALALNGNEAIEISKVLSNTLDASLSDNDGGSGSHGFSYEFKFTDTSYSGGIANFAISTDGCTSLEAEKGTPVILVTKPIDGSFATNELVLSESFKSIDEVSAVHAAFKVAPIFSVLGDVSDVATLHIFDTSAPISELLTFTIVYTDENGATATGNIPWDASDYTIESHLRTLLSSDDIIVTRHVDAVNAPNGFVHTIYCETSGLLSALSTTQSIAAPSEVVLIDVPNSVTCVATDPATCIFTGTNLPLGLASDHTASATYIGRSDASLLPVYRVSGFSWDVTFDSNLGELPNLVLSDDKLQGDSLDSSVNDLFSGALPTFTVADSLNEGIQYYFRSRLITAEGFSEPSSVMGGIPRGNPEGVHHVAVGTALHVDEVQTVTVAATHIDEVQTIQTTADFVPEVQKVRTYADEGAYLDDGFFALRWPEIQTVRISSQHSITDGEFALSVVNFFSTSRLNTVTVCVPWNVDEATLEAALNDALYASGDVRVTRTQVEWSSGEYSTDVGYGYEFAIAFVSSNVAGNVANLVYADTGDDGACTAFETSGASAVDVDINEITTMPFGTDIEIQRLSLTAAKPLSRGQYQLSFDGESTACLEHDATAESLESHLELLSKIDSVYVERFGDGSVDSEYGYFYNIFFDGNMLMRDDNEFGSMDLPKLAVITDGSCVDFQTITDNILTADGVDAVVEVFDGSDDCDICDDGGLDLPLSGATASSLKVELERLPANLVGYAHTSQSLLDDQGGQSWTMSFAAIEGDVDELYCALSGSTASGAGCDVETIVDGNVIGGTFLLSGAGPLNFDASFSEMQAAIESIAGIGDVAVTRSEPDGQLGYLWSVTFTSNYGDINPLVPTSSLTGTRASIQVEEVETGNYLSGSYTLSYLSQPSDPIHVSSTAEEFKASLESVATIGIIDVARSDIDSEGGSVYTVTFRDTSNPGDTAPLVPNTDLLVGTGAVVVVSEEVKGSEATATDLWLSFEASVDGNGDPIRSYEVSWDTSATFDANVKSFESNMESNVDDSEKFYRQQRVVTGSHSARPSFNAQPRQNEVQKITIAGTAADTFKLTFRNIEIDNDIVLGTSTLEDLQSALRGLYPAITLDGVDITGVDGVGDPIALGDIMEDGVELFVEFLEEPGLLPLLDVDNSNIVISREVPGDASYRKEIQSLLCSATGGTFSVKFDDSEEVIVDYSVDLDTLKERLESLPTLGVGGITIATSSDDLNSAVQICAGVEVFLVFNNYLGNAPDLEYNTDGLTGGTIDSSVEIVRGISPQYEFVSGYYRLSLNGEPTNILDVRASAARVRSAVEALPSVTTASVAVEMSKAEIGLLSAVTGQQHLTCPSSSCGFEYGAYGFPGDWIFLESSWYRIVAPTEDTAGYWPALSSERLYIGDAAGQPTSYLGAGGDSVRTFIWSMGYESTIRILRHSFLNDIVPPFVPSFHALAPADARIWALASDCNKCAYISSESSVGLTPGELYHVKAVARNEIGPNEASEVVSAQPRAIPGPPTHVELTVLSGSELQVYFSPPSLPSNAAVSGYNDDIDRYTVQWSKSMAFLHGTPLCQRCAHSLDGDIITTDNLVGDVSPGATITISNDNNCVMTVSSLDEVSVTVITGHGCGAFMRYDVESAFDVLHYEFPPAEFIEVFQAPPLSYLINGLDDGVEYFVRVAGRNSVPVQAVNPTGNPPDNTQWSSTLSEMPEDKRPSAPVLVEMFPFSAEKMLIYITPPQSDGMGMDGLAITKYVIEWDTHSSFSAAVSSTVDVDRDSGCPRPDPVCPLPELTSDGPLLYTITNLDINVPVFVRVYAVNTVGPSLPTMAINSGIAPLSSPSAPALAASTTVALDGFAPISFMDIEWSLPSNDGGSQISGYRVEWWSAESRRPEVQVVTLWWDGDTIPANDDCTWVASYGAATSSSLEWDIPAINLRNGLMNMRDSDLNLVFGNVEVSRSPVNTNKGFTWRITFEDILNEGDIPDLQLTYSDCGSESDFNFEGFQLIPGISLPTFEVSGKEEVQVLETSNSDTMTVSGFFRMKFKGSAWTNYLSSSASATEMQESLEGLISTGGITVERSDDDGTGFFAWTVTFHNNVGDLEGIVVDTSYLLPEGDAVMTVYDGDNLVDANGVRICDDCVVGETAVEYNYVDVGADTYAHRVEGLLPGKSYYGAITARNDISGYGDRKAIAIALTLPLQKPGMPTNVSPAVHYGDSERLEVTFAPPQSDGGSPVLYYMVQWDPTPTFDNPGSEIYNCPTHPTRATWVVTMRQDTGSSTIVAGGYFKLTLRKFNMDYVTDPIPFDAVAMGNEEVGDDTDDSKVHCIQHDGDIHGLCPTARLEASGSMEKKVEQLSIVDDVVVSRGDGATDSTYSWTITFRDDGDDVSVHIDLLNNLNVVAADSVAQWTMDIEQKVTGEVYPTCTGTQVTPTAGGLTKGQYYYVRVFAYNEVGFGVAQRSVFPEKPMVIPGAPTAVTLEVVSSYQLRVVFNPPDDDGGDTVTRYVVEWSKSSSFEDVSSADVLELSGGAPFFNTIGSLVDPLDQGVYYWVRLSSCNSQGCSAFPQASSPPALNPHESPSAPTSVILGVTSDSMLTVSFFVPTNNGGDEVSSYVIEWDTSSEFNSLDLPPHKDSFEVQDALSHASYTIESLSESRSYFVRVFAKNSAGAGTPQDASPSFGVPIHQIPGKPHSLIATTGVESGELHVAWQRPYVPNHGIPCYGTVDAPLECPDRSSLGDYASDGGAAINRYRIQFIQTSDFDMISSDNSWTDAQNEIACDSYAQDCSVTLGTSDGLALGAEYYVRVQAYNSQGYGSACSTDDSLLCAGDGDLVSATAQS